MFGTIFDSYVACFCLDQLPEGFWRFWGDVLTAYAVLHFCWDAGVVGLSSSYAGCFAYQLYRTAQLRPLRLSCSLFEGVQSFANVQSLGGRFFLFIAPATGLTDQEPDCSMFCHVPCRCFCFAQLQTRPCGYLCLQACRLPCSCLCCACMRARPHICSAFSMHADSTDDCLQTSARMQTRPVLVHPSRAIYMYMSCLLLPGSTCVKRATQGRGKCALLLLGRLIAVSFLFTPDCSSCLRNRADLAACMQHWTNSDIRTSCWLALLGCTVLYCDICCGFATYVVVFARPVLLYCAMHGGLTCQCATCAIVTSSLTRACCSAAPELLFCT